jgi:arylformamidase
MAGFDQRFIVPCILAPRLLFKTGSFPDANAYPERFESDFNALSSELIDTLAAQGVVLFGIDTPSIDSADSKTLEAHQAVYRNDAAVLEGLQLKHVPDGVYNLIALPLKLEGADASPVRAVLLR